MHREVRVPDRVVHLPVGEGVRQALVEPLHRLVVESVLEELRDQVVEDGVGDHPVPVRLGLLVGVEGRREVIDRVRAELALALVLLPGPHHLDRPPESGRDGRRLAHFIGAQAPPEPGAEEGVVKVHLLGREARLLDRGGMRHRRVLRAGPDVRPLRGDVGRAVEGLHARMVEIGGDVGRLHRVRGCTDDPARVAFRDGRVVRRVVRISEHLEGPRDDALVAHVAVLARIPFLRHELKGGQGPVVRVRDDCDPALKTARPVGDLVEVEVELADPALAETVGGDHPGTVLDRVEVEADEPSARDRRGLDRCVDHVRHLNVDPVDRPAVGLERGVQARHRLAEKRELIGGLDGGLRLELDCRGRGRELAVGAGVVAGAQDTVGGGDGRPLDPQASAAACLRRSRALAPAWWRYFLERRTAPEPPVDMR